VHVHPLLATVGLRIEPAPPGSGITFARQVELGSMPFAFFRAVEETVPQVLREGLHGWQVVDCAVTMTHSGYWAQRGVPPATSVRASVCVVQGDTIRWTGGGIRCGWCAGPRTARGPGMDERDVGAALSEVLGVLRAQTHADWGVPAGDLRWTCRATAVHVAHDLLAYAAQVAGRAAGGYLPLDLTVRDTATPAQVLDVVQACGTLLVRALAGAGGGDRAWHWGPTDPGGFAALGVNELLVHTWDITQGLGVSWRPPARLAAAVVTRLFPDLPGADLLWCTGRIALPDRPRRTRWTLRASTGPEG
jgi:hypothetical protein